MVCSNAQKKPPSVGQTWYIQVYYVCESKKAKTIKDIKTNLQLDNYTYGTCIYTNYLVLKCPLFNQSASWMSICVTGIVWLSDFESGVAVCDPISECATIQMSCTRLPSSYIPIHTMHIYTYVRYLKFVC